MLLFILLGGCFVVVGSVTANLIVTTAMADADIQQLQIIKQPVNYEYKCKYYTLRLREVNASTNMIQNNLNQLSEGGWVLDETVLHRDNEEWQTIFQIFKRPKKLSLLLNWSKCKLTKPSPIMDPLAPSSDLTTKPLASTK